MLIVKDVKTYALQRAKKRGWVRACAKRHGVFGSVVYQMLLCGAVCVCVTRVGDTHIMRCK